MCSGKAGLDGATRRLHDRVSWGLPGCNTSSLGRPCGTGRRHARARGDGRRDEKGRALVCGGARQRTVSRPPGRLAAFHPESHFGPLHISGCAPVLFVTTVAQRHLFLEACTTPSRGCHNTRILLVATHREVKYQQSSLLYGPILQTTFCCRIFATRRKSTSQPAVRIDSPQEFTFSCTATALRHKITCWD